MVLIKNNINKYNFMIADSKKRLLEVTKQKNYQRENVKCTFGQCYTDNQILQVQLRTENVLPRIKKI